MATVTFENVSKRFGDVVAVDDLNLDIRDAEFMVLVGPSGCGKTTSLRMIAGLEEITDGTLRIGEKIINDVPPKDRDIAMVFQSYALYPHMTIRDNLAFGLKLRHIPKVQIEARVKEAAAILDLTRYLDRKPRELSGGQRQRVALGRAIVREPAVFLMDEPLSNLDAKLRVETPSQHPPPAPAPQHHVRVRDPRPDRGHDDGHSDRGHERGSPAAGRHSAGALRPADQPFRGRLHRQPGDELRHRRGRRQRRRRRRSRARTSPFRSRRSSASRSAPPAGS